MDPAHKAIDAAIAQAVKARAAIRRGSTKQVRSADELDQLRSLVHAWFYSHRPEIERHAGHLEVSEVDAMYRSVLELAARHTVRSKYVETLRAIKDALLVLQRDVTLPRPATSASMESPPSFAPLASDARMQNILVNRWNECQRCMGNEAYLAATVMMGGMLETLLVSRANGMAAQKPLFTAKATPKDRTGNPRSLGEWKLVDYIAVAHELQWITKSALQVGTVLREYRNYVHPHKEYSDGITVTEDDANLFWEITKILSKQVLASTARTP